MSNDTTAVIAFIGGGNMARALIGGLVGHGVAPARLRVGEPQSSLCEGLARDFSIEASTDNAHAIRDAELVVLAVKPQEALRVLGSLLEPLSRRRPLLLSIAAGVRLADLARVCPADLPVVRAMPNRAALLGAGVTGLYAPSAIDARERALAERVASAAGRAVWLRTESELDIVTALSGSGPAYFFLLAEQMARAAEALGLERATASLLASETLYGAGLLARAGPSLAEQRAAVTSKGGTTEAALRVLQQGGFDALVAQALAAAAARSAELATEQSTVPA
jgi:pyrroline-5-carboxylate reductase